MATSLVDRGSVDVRPGDGSEDESLNGSDSSPLLKGGGAASPGSSSGGGGPAFKGYEPFPEYLQCSALALWNYNTSITWMLIFVPITFVCKLLGLSEGFIFFASLLGLIPLAALLGCTTEALASYTNQTLGGLLNATFGNATEVIISAIALASAGPENQMIRVIQLSLLGSILSNLLLVLGCAFVAGGYRQMTRPDVENRKKVQTYNSEAAGVNGAMLTLSVIAIIFPDVLAESGMIGHCALLDYSRYVSVIMLLMYFVYLWFQLKCVVTHSLAQFRVSARLTCSARFCWRLCPWTGRTRICSRTRTRRKRTRTSALVDRLGGWLS